MAFEKKLLDNCKTIENATDEDVNVLLERNLPTERTGKCLLACTQETLGLVSVYKKKKTVQQKFDTPKIIFSLLLFFKIKDGKPSTEGLISMAKIVHVGNTTAIVTTLLDDCGQITDTDRCELAAKFMQCGQKSAIKHGFDPKKII